MLKRQYPIMMGLGTKILSALVSETIIDYRTACGR